MCKYNLNQETCKMELCTYFASPWLPLRLHSPQLPILDMSMNNEN